MGKPNNKTNMSPEDQEFKERPTRSGDLAPQEGSVGLSEEFRRLSRTHEGRRMLIKQIASSGSPEDIKPGGPVSEDFWKLPKVKDPEGLLLKALLEDREQGR